MLVELFDDYLRFVIVCTAFPLGVSAVVGLAVSVLQAATQIQEQTVSYLTKLTAVTVVVWLGGESAVDEGLQLVTRTIRVVALLGEAAR